MLTLPRAENVAMENFRLRWNGAGSRGQGVLAAVGGPAAVTLLAMPDRHPPTAVVAVLYVLAVVIAARLGGVRSGVAASLLSFLSLNFFFTRPLHTFVVGAPEDLVSLTSNRLQCSLRSSWRACA
jgi:K+-sensing histidine kinase KdpD